MTEMASFKDIHAVSSVILKTCSTMKSSSLFMIFTAQKTHIFPTILTLHLTLAKWMIHNALLSLEFINVISLLLLIILKYLTTSIVNSTPWVTELKDSVCYYDGCLILVGMETCCLVSLILSIVTNTVLDYIYGTHGHRITHSWVLPSYKYTPMLYQPKARR